MQKFHFKKNCQQIPINFEVPSKILFNRNVSKKQFHLKYYLKVNELVNMKKLKKLSLVTEESCNNSSEVF